MMLTLPFDLIDVSENQGVIDWQALTDGTNLRRVCIRLGEGYLVDKQASRNWQEAGRLGWERAVYHSLHAELPDIDRQARILTTTPDGIKPELFQAGDCELRYVNGKLLIDRTLAYLKSIEAQSRTVPWIYTAAWFWDAYMIDEQGRRPLWAANYRLWVADYRKLTYPQLPRGWYRYELWQQGIAPVRALPGITTRIDYDTFNRRSDPDAYTLARAVAVARSLAGDRLQL